jgi:hypothetical protein
MSRVGELLCEHRGGPQGPHSNLSIAGPYLV